MECWNMRPPLHDSVPSQLHSATGREAPVFLARHAMATRFEIVLHGDNPVALRAAGEKALEEIDPLEAQLSPFPPPNENSRLNPPAPPQPLQGSRRLFAPLQAPERMHRQNAAPLGIALA